MLHAQLFEIEGQQLLVELQSSFEAGSQKDNFYVRMKYWFKEGMSAELIERFPDFDEAQTRFEQFTNHHAIKYAKNLVKQHQPLADRLVRERGRHNS